MFPAGSRTLWVTCVALMLSLLVSLWGKLANVPNKDCMSCDAGWYQQIAEEGYRIPVEGDLGHWHGADIHQTEWAFFPLYPWLLGEFASASGLGIPAAMLVLSAFLSGVVVVLALRLFTMLNGPEVAFWGSLALLLQPFGIYFHLGMTEGLFLAGLLGSFLSVAQRSWIGLAVCSTVLVLTRPNGLFLLPVLMLFAAEVDGMDLRGSLQRPAYWLKRGAPLIVPLLAFAVYSVFQWHRTGDPFAFSTAQAGWGRSFTWPWTGFFNAGDVATQFDSWYTLALLACAVAVRKKLAFSFNLLIWIGILLPLFSGSVASMPRLTTVMFPLFLLAGVALAEHRWRVPILAASFLLQLVWLQLWFQGAWITC